MYVDKNMWNEQLQYVEEEDNKHFVGAYKLTQNCRKVWP
jgi:hypothetical protein